MVFRIIFAAISFLILFNGITDFYFFKRAICRFTDKKIYRQLHWGLSGFFAVLNIWLVFQFTSPTADPASTIYVWSMLVYFIVYLPKATFMVVSFPELYFKKVKFLSITGAILGVVAGLMLVWGATFGRFDFVTRSVEIHSAKLPDSFNNYKIVQFSDTHLGNFGHSDRIVDELVARINALHPDLIVFTGDLVNTKASEIDRFQQTLSKLRAKDGVYSIMGNHDYGDYVNWNNKADYVTNLRNLHQKQADLGWKLIGNEHTFLHHGTDSVALIGVENWGEPPFHQYGNLDKAIAGMKYDGFKILLSHNPEHWRLVVASKYDIDLTLAGHTHAGQMVVKLGGERYSPIVLKYKKWGGYFELNGKSLYVNEGIGYVLYPMRFGTGPEVTVLTLRK
ncbi:MAG: metallophosphoesterase [Bacteroidales bacterium]|nr:metallophosphoesterase [Bacteroidales bacterium]